MDRFLCVQAFVRVAEGKSFAGAARQLGVTRSVVSSRIKALEKLVRAPLFHRSTRRVKLSEAGAACFEECADLISRFEAVTDRMRLTHETPIGSLRLQVLPGFALGHLGKAIKGFHDLYPDIGLDITVSDMALNPVDGGFDISLQIFRSAAESLIERSLFPVRRLFFASPSYLETHGEPRTPVDLLQHTLSLYSAYPTRNRWTFCKGGKEITLELPASIRSTSVHLLRDFARADGGITCLPTLVCSEDLLNGDLVPLLTDYTLPPLELVAIFPATHRRAVKVRMFIDYIAQSFSGEPEWDRALTALRRKKPKSSRPLRLRSG